MLGMTLAQCTIWSVIHDQKRNVVIYSTIPHLYDIGMHKIHKGTCFDKKALNITVWQVRSQHFDSNGFLK